MFLSNPVSLFQAEEVPETDLSWDNLGEGPMSWDDLKTPEPTPAPKMLSPRESNFRDSHPGGPRGMVHRGMRPGGPRGPPGPRGMRQDGPRGMRPDEYGPRGPRSDGYGPRGMRPEGYGPRGARPTGPPPLGDTNSDEKDKIE